MLENDNGPNHVLGFARYEKRASISPDDLVAAALRWQEEFLAGQDGISFHAFLGNLRGGYADLMLARDEAAISAMMSQFPKSQASIEFLELLDPSSVRLCQSTILKNDLTLPRDFSCIEFGTFKVSPGVGTDEVRQASDHIEATYLRTSPNTRAHFAGRIDPEIYCEVLFGRTLAATRRTCFGYVGNPDCEPLLRLITPNTAELDFWYLLA